MDHESCPLLSLSTELIFQIVGYSDPPDILALGLTCSDLHHRCRSLLEQHQDAYEKYRVTSDLSPETVVDLLKDTPAAEINRYHVRELEFWGSRLKWQDWRSWNPALSGNYRLAEEEPSRSAWDAREVEEYIQKGLGLWDLTEEGIEELRMSLERGSEAWLKLLIISLCPRLHSIRFVKRRGDSYNILAWMAMAISWSVEYGWQWPPGFESLRSISVGISMLSHVSHEEEEEYYDGFEEFTKLFHIPNLENIYFNGLSCEENMWEEHIWDKDLLPDGTSNVENLFLDGVEGGWDDFYDWLSRASTKLDTVVLRAIDSRRGGLHDVGSLVDSLANTNEKLKRLVLYHPEAIHDQPCRPSEIYNHESIKQITMAASDIYFRFDYAADDRTFRESDIPFAFPPNIEAVYIWGEWKGLGFRDQRGLRNLDMFLAELIESGVYKHLKVVYVERPYRELLYGSISNDGLGTAERRKHAFQRAIVAGHKTGVHVCTHRDDGGYWKNFPARPDRFDIKTGPYAAERPADWKINLETGEWEPDWMWRM
ncbi:uncharacterized protein B0J16DRAFT_412261 [Fusarium flagelliforme]|uniref:F-box domain-containing protein n=1 Tax=Fusarium flagelliforme TaxID=2675880 RepID=A0A395MKH1_9HYPO|nr:uncharacterized protein B0J16DRAFT_412261 [Fusarium flagelliforme]KAH7193692.1 hypothetical protein B0J16DRAFT_412261 [Fusarium flagelliforme]RFN48270.1 hypothetical protein FIE12Z_7437 [Fusarium flagelliforme]